MRNILYYVSICYLLLILFGGYGFFTYFPPQLMGFFLYCGSVLLAIILLCFGKSNIKYSRVRKIFAIFTGTIGSLLIFSLPLTYLFCLLGNGGGGCGDLAIVFIPLIPIFFVSVLALIVIDVMFFIAAKFPNQDPV